MEVRFKPELQAKLDQVASDGGNGTAEYVQLLVEHYLDHDAWLRQKIKAGVEQLDQR